MEETVNNNIQKVRRTCYSLMPVGFHGNNGVDPATCIHLLKIYVVPVLTYGLEVLLPVKKFLDRLELFFERLLKQILSLPTNTADRVPYIFWDFYQWKLRYT